MINGNMPRMQGGGFVLSKWFKILCFRHFQAPLNTLRIHCIFKVNFSGFSLFEFSLYYLYLFSICFKFDLKIYLDIISFCYLLLVTLGNYLSIAKYKTKHR